MLFSFITDYTYVIAPILGLIPALFWLWFWLKEDLHPEPKKMIALSFLGGMVTVLFVLPLQRLVYDYVTGNEQLSFFLWATIEEVAKFAVVYVIALRNKVTDEPVDNIIYMIVAALGFVAFENTLFLIDPLHSGDVVGTLVTGNLRFIGASLLHIIASGTIGIFMGLSFYKSKLERRLYRITGVILAVALHTTFNLFIIREPEQNLFFIFGSVWTGIVLLLLMFEKVKHIIPNNTPYER